MAASPDNSSKITDYSPQSPSQEINKIDKTDTIKSDPQLESLTGSSVIITPKSTPEKDKSGNGSDKEEASVVSNKEEDLVSGSSKEEQDKAEEKQAETKDEATKLPDKSAEEPEVPKSETLEVKERSAKKALTGKLNKEAEKEQESPKPKSRRRGRKKKERPPSGKAGSAVASTPSAPKAPSTSSSEQKTSGRKKKEKSSAKNRLLTDFFPVRRSDRKCKTDIQFEKEEDLHTKILKGCEDGLKVENIENKGRGVVATKKFSRGDFVVEYAGDLINISEAKNREAKYAAELDKGCYMYYFQHKNKNYCIDATDESGKLGRLLNHSKTHGNCHTKLVDIKGHPYLILVASRDITEGEELLYDYGDRSKESLAAHPWLKS